MKKIDNPNFIKIHKRKYKTSPKIIIEEEENSNFKILAHSKIKKENNHIIEILPLIKLKNGKKYISKKAVKEESNKQSSRSSRKNIEIKVNNNNTSKNKNEIRFNTDLNKNNLVLDNNDSFYFENQNKYNNIIDNNIIINSGTINSYCNKSISKYKNKRKNTNYNSEELNDVFKQLIDIKHKIKNINTQKKYKISQFNINLSNISKKKQNFKLNNQYNQNISNCYTRNHNNISYNKTFSTFTSNIKTPKDIKVLKRTKSLKPNINIVNFKKSANSYRRFNEHIKYILHIRDHEINSLANQFQKALEENEKEKAFHYKNRIFPLEMIERLIKIKGDLTLNKFRNEYLKTLDRYDIHPLRKFLDNEKKNVKANKAKIFKGIFSKLVNIK